MIVQDYAGLVQVPGFDGLVQVPSFTGYGDDVASSITSVLPSLTTTAENIAAAIRGDNPTPPPTPAATSSTILGVPSLVMYGGLAVLALGIGGILIAKKRKRAAK